MKVDNINIEPVQTTDYVIRAIINHFEEQTKYDSNVLYDVLSKMMQVEEANRVIESIFNGNQFKITFQLKDDVNVNELIINIGDIYCPETKEHGKMTCTYFNIEQKNEELFLTITYKCMHPKCRAERFINEYLPKIWKEAKEIIPKINFKNIITKTDEKSS